jgi:hypothetical protein
MKNKLFWLITLIVFAILSSCGSGGGGGGSSDSGTSGVSSTDEANVILNLDFSTMFLGDENMANANLNVSNIDLSVNDSVIEPSGFPISFAIETFSGTLVLLNANDDSVAYTFPITATMDSSWDANLQQSIVVKPGAYKFNIQFQKNSYQYLGTTTATVTGGNNTIALNVNPVIGDTLVTTTVIETPTFSFNYPAADFNSLADPELDVIIDGSTDVTLVLAQFTGDEYVYINLTGTHDIELLLRDGTTDVAKFAQTNFTFVAGTNYTLDLTAIFGRVGINLTESGGDATFNFFIPSEVVDEVGALGDLRATFSLDGDNNDPTSDILSLSEDASGDYTASTVISGIQYDMLSIDLQFEDISGSPFETIGTCSFDVTVDVSADSGSCAITLIRRAVISGQFFQVVAANVVGSDGNAISGATIVYNDGSGDSSWPSLTGSGAFGTDGYVEMLLTPGSYNFRAEYSGFSSNDVSEDIDASDTGYLLLYLNN